MQPLRLIFLLFCIQCFHSAFAVFSPSPHEQDFNIVGRDVDRVQRFSAKSQTNVGAFLGSPQMIPRNLTSVTIFQVTMFSSLAPDFTLVVSSSQSLRVFKETPDTNGFPSSQFRYRVEVLKTVPLVDVLKATLRHFANVTKFDDVWIEGHREWTEAFIQASIAKKFLLGSVNLHQGPIALNQVNEQLLQRQISTAQVSRLNVDSAAGLSDAFFHTPAVQDMYEIVFKRVTKNLITDENLVNLAAVSRLALGNASQITQEGARRFFQAKLDKFMRNPEVFYSQDSLEFKPSFAFRTQEFLSRLRGGGKNEAWTKTPTADAWKLKLRHNREVLFRYVVDKKTGVVSFNLMIQ